MSLKTGWQCNRKCHLCSSVESWVHYHGSRMAFLMAGTFKEWYNMLPDARWRSSKGPAPFKVKKSPILKVPGLSGASSALIDAAHTWHMGPLYCRLLGFMSYLKPTLLPTVCLDVAKTLSQVGSCWSASWSQGVAYRLVCLTPILILCNGAANVGNPLAYGASRKLALKWGTFKASSNVGYCEHGRYHNPLINVFWYML